MTDLKSAKVLITGGLGFIGSNLAARLVNDGAKVTLVDSLIPEYGGNLWNIKSIESKVTVNISDVRDDHAMKYLIQGHDYLFNLAGQTSHLDSMNNPFPDLEINARSQLSILEACRKHNTKIKIVFASTRQVYGAPQALPVDERHPLQPVDVNGINKIAGEGYHLLYNNVYGIKATALRLTNTYGPHMRIKDARQTFLGIWVKRLLEKQPILVYGDGKQIRDFNYVDDVVDALIAAALSDDANGQIFNLGADDPVSLKDTAQMMVDIAKEGSYQIVPFPGELKQIDIGDYYGDYRKIRSKLGWKPQTKLNAGLKKTIEYFKEHGNTISNPQILLANPGAQYLAHKAEIDEAISAVLKSGWYILGKEVEAFEREFADFIGVKEGIGVANGTDAIAIALKACGVQPGDEVITVSHSAVATAAAIEQIGAVPVFCDIEADTHCLDPKKLEALISPKSKAVVPVHIYGHPADIAAVAKITARHKLSLIEDCAQAHGAEYQGQRVGSFGDAAAFSFYPTKNLGAIGDGGGVVTNSKEIAEKARMFRQYGWRERYISEIAGLNTRLDEIQAAILRVKLRHLGADNQKRRVIASAYASVLDGKKIKAPQISSYALHAMHLFVVECEERHSLKDFLQSRGIQSGFHYPLAIHNQVAYKGRIRGGDNLPVTDNFYTKLLSLPIYPELGNEEVERVKAALLDWQS